jgi:uncharacterized membrane protein
MNILSRGFHTFSGHEIGEGMAFIGGNLWLFVTFRIIGFVLFIILVVFLIRRTRKNKYLNKLKEEYILGNVTEEEYLHKKEVLKVK